MTRKNKNTQNWTKATARMTQDTIVLVALLSTTIGATRISRVTTTNGYQETHASNTGE